MARSRTSRPSQSNLRAKAKRQAVAQTYRGKRRMEVRTAWAAGVLSVVIAVGSVLHFLNAPVQPFQGRGAATANSLHARFGPVGPALPWLAISGILAFISVAAAKGWGKDVD